MKLKITWFIVLFICAFANKGVSQLNVEFPAERAVFQRDNSNSGFVMVHGLGPKTADFVEGRLVPMVNGQGITTEWQLIDNQISDGTYSGKVAGTGGWYQLQIRAIKNGFIVSNASVNKVGIGEVFIVAGQSNAQGFLAFNPPFSFDDRVNGYAYYDKNSSVENPSLTNIAHLDRELNLGPHGQSAWAWGKLGDLLAAKFNVPILFFNAAYEGTSIENWVSSSQGLPTTHTSPEFTLNNGTPYSFLRIILQNHASIYGIRSIIWIQGENDLFTPQSEYRTQLDFLVKKTSADVGKSINWLVSRTSLSYNQVHEQIIAAQNEVIAMNSNVFAGPNTDGIQVPRKDGAHLSNEGIIDLAYAFDQTLSSSQLNLMTPAMANPVEKLNYECISDNVYKIATAKTFNQYNWSTSAQSASIQIRNGAASALLRDVNGNYHISEKIDVNGLIPDPPVLLAENNGVACIGAPAVFFINSATNAIQWFDGSTSNYYPAYTTDPVTAIFIDNKGCKSLPSESRMASFTPRPPAPSVVSLSTSLGACDGQSVKLKANSNSNRYRWNTGETTQEISVFGVGNKELQVLTITPDGCESEFSDPVLVKIFPKPTPPSIDQTGPYSLGVRNPQIYSSYEWFYEGQKIEGQNGIEIPTSGNGFYSIKGFESHASPFTATCLSNSSGLVLYEKEDNQNGIQAFPNPVVGNEFYLTSEVSLDAIISIKDINGRTLLSPKVVNQLTTPRKIQLANKLVTGTYILTVDYQGFQKRFKLFFE